MNAIMVSVDYTDLLRLTLPYNRHHFDRVMVVTSPADEVNVRPVCEACNAEVYVTDAFYRHGALFNKWLALEEGLDHFDRKGWLCLMDADVAWPKELAWWRHEVETNGYGLLYTPLRRMCEQVPLILHPESEWARYKLHRQEMEWAGYSQVFHADDPVLGSSPWHQTNWLTAGGADSFFQAKWPRDRKVRPPFNVLHLGPAGVNWAGRASAYTDGRVPSDAEVKKASIRDMIRKRGSNRQDRFYHEKIHLVE